ncbi:hypothetical protein [Pedobacter sp. WC2423]|uniref:hypothetical protein n=1 Tax=Pedobacter sp. WC2423 TaxID=3234142 RepID=UPI0034665410
MKQKLLVLLGVTGFISFFSSCEELLQRKCSICPTSQEIEIRNNIANEYNCNVSVGHDEGAVYDNRIDGSFGISLDFTAIKSTEKNLCEKDSLYLDSLSRIIAKKIIPILSHKKNYNRVSVSYSTEKNFNEKMSSTDCSKEFEIPIKDL